MPPIQPVALFIFDFIIVFILLNDLAVLRAAFAEKKPFNVPTQLVRVLFFSIFLLIVLIFGYLNSLLVIVGLLALTIAEAAVILILLPRIGRAIQGAVSEALIGGIMTVFGMGTSAISIMGKNYDGLLPGLAIMGLGGWMLYAAIKKMSQGE